MVRKLMIGSLAAIAAFASVRAAADSTGFWYDPAESGWGLNIAEQDGTAFAVLLVYDANGAPGWFVASALVPIGSDFSPFIDGPPSLRGSLYRTSGSWFGAAFDPAAVHAQTVGTLQLAFSAQPEIMHVTYSIDGRTINKHLTRQTWASSLGKLFGGHYEGGLYLKAAPATGCVTPSFAPAAGRAFVFEVAPSVPPATVHMQWGTGIDTACRIEGAYEQHGQLGAVSGTLTCGPIGTTTPIATIKLDSLQLSDHGFIGAATVTQAGCVYTGHVGGVRQGS